MKFKSLFFFILSFISFISIYSQAPQGFNYQAIARDNDNNVLANTGLDVKIGLLQGGENGTLIWEEIHTVTTNDLGLFTLTIGDTTATNSGFGSATTFSDIDWTTGSYYMKVQVDDREGGGYVDMGTTELQSVPYSLFAESGNKQTLSIEGHKLTISDGNMVVLPDSVIDDDADPSNEIQDLQITGNDLSITNNASASSIDLSTYLDNTDNWVVSGDSIYYLGSVGVGTSTPASKMAVQGDDVASEEPLFQVKRKDGQTVFAVYNEGVRIFVDTASAKGPKGGFAVGGFSSGKASQQEFFRVTPDSVRIYVDTTTSKGPKGGFAVGGYSTSKGPGGEFLRVTQDSVRVYIDEDKVKGPKGGFAVGGYSTGKSSVKQYFNVSGSSTAQIIDPSQPRILWYPRKGAFLAGQVLIEHPDSIGMNSIATGFESIAKGDWSNAMGFKSIARGNYSSAIGKFSETNGVNSFAIGSGAKTIGNDSYSFGSGAVAGGHGSFAFGSVARDSLGNIGTNFTRTTGEFSFAFGLGARSNAIGSFSVGTNCISDGDFAFAGGFHTTASGVFSTALGSRTRSLGDYSSSLGYFAEATGYASVALGFNTVASGSRSFAMGSDANASGFASIAMGENSRATNLYSIAMGLDNQATGQSAVSMGNGTIASGDYSLAMGSGSQAIGYQSVAFGGTAKGNYSVAMGVGSKADAFGSLVIGRFNEGTGDPAVWNANEPLFIAGNGTGEIPGNALILYKDGNMTIAGGLTQDSDIRLKQNINRIPDVLTKLKHIDPVYFNYRNVETHPDGRQIGLIAQEVKELFPELVKENPGGYLGVDYSRMSAILLQAVKEQQEIIEKLQNENEQLQNFEQRLKKIEKKIK